MYAQSNGCLPARQSGFTLIELAVVMAVLGAIAIAATSMFGSSGAVESLRAREEAHVFSQALRTARSTAIASGANMRIEAIFDDGRIAGFRTISEASPKELAQPDHYFAGSLKTDWSTKEITFFPSGMADNSLEVVLASELSTWILEMRSASGQVTVFKK